MDAVADDTPVSLVRDVGYTSTVRCVRRHLEQGGSFAKTPGAQVLNRRSVCGASTRCFEPAGFMSVRGLYLGPVGDQGGDQFLLGGAAP